MAKKRKSYRGTPGYHRELYGREARDMRDRLMLARRALQANRCDAAFNRLQEAGVAYGKMQAHGLWRAARGSGTFNTLEMARARFKRKCLRK